MCLELCAVETGGTDLLEKGMTWKTKENFSVVQRKEEEEKDRQMGKQQLIMCEQAK